jgi:L-ascorbate metabolism protein UlaG (beta-lactamase superfamily)
VKLEYISHACVLIDTGTLKIVSDPWLEGPAYLDQWHVFPRPVRPEAAADADVLVISHGHEDHLHGPTLESLPNKAAQVCFPYYWTGGVVEYLHEIGFGKVAELPSGRPQVFADGTRLTFVVNGQDAVIVLEKDGFVLMNVNDALHSSQPEVIDRYLAHLRRHWPRIDVVLCGFGGASFYPNAFHLPGKDDAAVAVAREQLFAHNFCRIVEGLAPRVAVPFAADFCLLDPGQRWINRVRLPRLSLPDYFRAHFATAAKQTEIVPMFPGDRLDGATLVPDSPLRARLEDAEADVLMEEQYATEIAARAARPPLSLADCNALAGDVAQALSARAADFPQDQMTGLRYSIRLRDPAQTPYLQIAFEGVQPRVTAAREPVPGGHLVLETTAARLRYAIGSPWGGDVLVIGYGCDLEIPDPALVQDGTAMRCVELLTRYPDAKRSLWQSPARMLRYVASTWFASKHKIIERLRPDRPAPQAGAAGNFWLLEDAASIRRRCGLPTLDKPWRKSASSAAPPAQDAA